MEGPNRGDTSTLTKIGNVRGDTRTAIIAIPSKLTCRAEEIGKLHVGWTVCRLLRKLIPRRCFKCLDYGHVAKKWRSKTDWSKYCFKCGEQGYLTVACGRDPHCLVCRGDQDVNVNI